jgi:hypothetical protein
MPDRGGVIANWSLDPAQSTPHPHLPAGWYALLTALVAAMS